MTAISGLIEQVGAENGVFLTKADIEALKALTFSQMQDALDDIGGSLAAAELSAQTKVMSAPEFSKNYNWNQKPGLSYWIYLEAEDLEKVAVGMFVSSADSVCTGRIVSKGYGYDEGYIQVLVTTISGSLPYWAQSLISKLMRFDADWASSGDTARFGELCGVIADLFGNQLFLKDFQCTCPKVGADMGNTFNGVVALYSKGDMIFATLYHGWNHGNSTPCNKQYRAAWHRDRNYQDWAAV